MCVCVCVPTRDACVLLSFGPLCPVRLQSKSKSAKSKSEREFDLSIKLLLLGDSGVGKTSIMTRYSDKEFSASLMSTAGSAQACPPPPPSPAALFCFDLAL